MAPIVLGIDTSGTWCSAAVSGAPIESTRRLEVGNAHSDHLLAMIEAVLADADVRLEDCAAVAFGAGPGSFTGLRIACAVAQGLAYGAGIPVAPIGTLVAIAHSALKQEHVAPARLVVAQDARMGELYWCIVDDGDLMSAEPALDSPQRLRDLLSRDPAPIALGCGNAWSIHGAALHGMVERVVFRAGADAAAIAELGVRAVRGGRLTRPADAAPLYVRDRIAETTAERAARKIAVMAR